MTKESTKPSKTPVKPGDTLFLITRGISASGDPLLVVRRVRAARVTRHFIFITAHPETSRSEVTHFMVASHRGSRLNRTQHARYIATTVVDALKNYLEFCDERVTSFAAEAAAALNAQVQFLAQVQYAREMLRHYQNPEEGGAS
jgi:hypothetical protein